AEGAATASRSVTAPPGAPSAGIAARSPSHTLIDPSDRRRWYANRTGFGPDAYHVAVPVFVRPTEIVGAPARNAATLSGAGAYRAAYAPATYTVRDRGTTFAAEN